MEAPELAKLERLCRNLPVRQMQMERCPGTRGEIYFAYGRGPEGKYMGMCGYCGFAMPIEFKEEASLQDVRQMLVDAAEESANQLEVILRA